jgi:hypothetical protein
MSEAGMQMLRTRIEWRNGTALCISYNFIDEKKQEFETIGSESRAELGVNEERVLQSMEQSSRNTNQLYC